MRKVNSEEVLSHYFGILHGNQKSKYIVTKNKPVNFDYDSDEKVLWSIHDRIMKSQQISREGGVTNLLDLKWELARRLTKKCRLCERKCKVNRLDGKYGFCGVGKAKIGAEFIHHGEEPEIVPSYTVFFTGCTFRCVFCQNWDISQYPENGIFISSKTLAKMIDRTIAKNINFVGGEPTPVLMYILEVLANMNVNIPVIWNSNMYMSEDSMKILDGVVDLYLADFKYGNNDCAKRLSGVEHYFNTVSRNHIIANKQTDMIIRHLVMPNHVECCTKPILRWISENLELNNVMVNIMAQYRPEYHAHEYEEINRKITIIEYDTSYDYAKALGLNLVR